MKYKGLTSKEVEINRKKYGSNIITKENKNTFLKMLIESLSDPIIKILIIALLIKIIFLFKDADYFETIGILIAIFSSSLISSLSEYGSEKAFEQMEKESNKISSKVIRDNELKEVLLDDIVVGDIVQLESGDKIPADSILLEGSIFVDESSLTGESIEKEKTKEKDNKLFRGTSVYEGKCFSKVESVGDKTFYGEICANLQAKKSDSPLKIRLRILAQTISKIGYVAALLVSLSYLIKVIIIDNDFEKIKIVNTITNYKLMSSYLIYALTLCVTTLVVSVPEGLPMMVALVLSSNMKKLLKEKVLVRKLVGIETSGSLNILFTDKTGTLTEGKLKVSDFLSGNGIINKNVKKDKIYEEIKNCIIYTSESTITEEKIIGGNITDKCLIEYVKTSSQTLKIKEKELFNSNKKYSKVILENGNTYYKGAREVILPKCSYYYNENLEKKLMDKNVIKKVEEFENNGLRIICLASSKEYGLDNLTLIGFLIIKDTIRNNVSSSISLVQNSGIQVVMITGDNVKTATSIAKELGIVNSSNDIILTSKELNKLTDEEVKKIILNLRVVARMLPQDKLRLIKLSKELNLTVGMTGDGMNDAPALKQADVGFSLGSGTEVAKEASDIVLLDDNFKSITSAILYGRTIFKSIRKFIIFQLTINISAVLLSIIGPFIGIDSPVTVIQMLWINMIMDTFAGLAYAYEPALAEYMKEPPKKKDENFINKYMFIQIITSGLYIFICSILFLKLDFFNSLYRYDELNSYLLTAFFGLFIFFMIFNSFNARTNRINLLSNIYKNKVFIFIILFILVTQIFLIYYGGSLFRTTGLTFIELEVTLLLSLTIIPFDILRKIILRINKNYSGV